MNLEDKTLLVLFFSLIVIIFLDFQAKKQYHQIQKNIKKISVDELLEENKSNFEKLTRTIEKNKEKRILEEEIEKVKDLQKKIERTNDNFKENYSEIQSKNLKKIEEEIEIKKKNIQKLKEKLNKELENPYLRNISILTLPDDEKENTEFFLFFPGYKAKKTEMFKVKRRIKGKVTPFVALNILQKGPTSSETGLVNAYYSAIKLEQISYEEDKKRIHLFFDNNYLSNNINIQKDRDDQVCLTLKQFSNIEEIYIWVENKLYKSYNHCRREFKDY